MIDDQEREMNRDRRSSACGRAKRRAESRAESRVESRAESRADTERRMMIHGQKNDTVHGWTTSTWIGRKAAKARQKKGKLMHVRGGAEQLYTRERETGAIRCTVKTPHSLTTD